MMKSIKKFSLIFLFLVAISILSLVIVAILTPVMVDYYTTNSISLTNLPFLVKFIRSFDLVLALVTIISIISISALVTWMLMLFNRVLAILGVIVISIVIVVLIIGSTLIEYYAVIS